MREISFLKLFRKNGKFLQFSVKKIDSDKFRLDVKEINYEGLLKAANSAVDEALLDIR
ncbi:MAG: hypothetical protein ACK5V3_03115 [Bdellovibrionales bacterium]